MEYEHPLGAKTRGRTIFESVLDAHPKRADVWAVFVDKETKAGQVDAARALLARSATLKWRTHAMKALFKRWLRFEQQPSTPMQLPSATSATLWTACSVGWSAASTSHSRT